MLSIFKARHANDHYTVDSSQWIQCSELIATISGDLVRTRTHNDVILAEMPEFWDLILKLMDDIKESVRKSASKTSGKLNLTWSVRHCGSAIFLEVEAVFCQSEKFKIVNDGRQNRLKVLGPVERGKIYTWNVFLVKFFRRGKSRDSVCRIFTVL